MFRAPTSRRLFRPLRPSTGPSVAIDDPKTMESLRQDHRRDPSFDVDSKGTYWRIKPVYPQYVNQKQNLNNLSGQRKIHRKLMAEKQQQHHHHRAATGAGSTTPPSVVNIIEHAKLRSQAFGPLAFHHYLHGVEGRDAQERAPLLVRGSMMKSGFDAARIRREILASNTNNSGAGWKNIQLQQFLSVPFAVTPHVSTHFALLVAQDEKSNNNNSSVLLPSQKHQEETRKAIFESPMMQPIAPFSRKARHQRLIKSSSSSGSATEPVAVEWDEDASRCENIIVSGDASVVECSVSPLFFSAKSSAPPPFARVFLGTGDALYLPLGWNLSVTSFKGSMLSGGSQMEEQEDGDEKKKMLNQQQKEEGELKPAASSAVPFLLRFGYSPVPGTGPVARNRMQLRQYVGSDWSCSCSGFYARPIAEVLSKSGAGAGSSSAGRVGIARPMNA